MKKNFALLLLQLMVISAFAQFNLKGIVTDDEGPLAGASVVIDGGFYGVSTDSDGRFVFKNLKGDNYRIQVSFIGYQTKVVKVQLDTD
ncbi:MAG TPA: carboxypeptidase-like regulatory domain-containing protein, partial [Prolixibacteraceae bacterium]|nr:carboxypeptidase-like regulatory domain-containing protein [Prolixibacteraceae bacterium]